jgi:hypothetical protein
MSTSYQIFFNKNPEMDIEEENRFYKRRDISNAP